MVQAACPGDVVRGEARVAGLPRVGVRPGRRVERREVPETAPARAPVAFAAAHPARHVSALKKSNEISGETARLPVSFTHGAHRSLEDSQMATTTGTIKRITDK